MSNAICRFLYDLGPDQTLPATSGGDRVRSIHQDDRCASALGVPAGYGGDSDTTNRNNLPPDVLAGLRVGDPVEDDKLQPLFEDELLYSAREMHVRALEMQQRWDRALSSFNPPLQALPPELRRSRWSGLMKKAKAAQLNAGIRGLPGWSCLSYFRCGSPLMKPVCFRPLVRMYCYILFHGVALPGSRAIASARPCLSCSLAPLHASAPVSGPSSAAVYCRYEHFFHFAIAHLTLYGLVKDFWNVWARPPSRHRGATLPKKNRFAKLADCEYILPRHIRLVIAARGSQIKWCSGMKNRSADLLG